METLTIASNPTIFNSLLFFILLGVAFFAAATTGMVFLFGLSLKDANKNIPALGFFLILSIIMPATVVGLQSKITQNAQAIQKIKIVNHEVVRAGKDSFIVNMNTSVPVVLYLLYQDRQRNFQNPILPTQTLAPRTSHSFIISGVGNEGGQATIVIDNTAYLINGQTLKIND